MSSAYGLYASQPFFILEIKLFICFNVVMEKFKEIKPEDTLDVDVFTSPFEVIFNADVHIVKQEHLKMGIYKDENSGVHSFGIEIDLDGKHLTAMKELPPDTDVDSEPKITLKNGQLEIRLKRLLKSHNP